MGSAADIYNRFNEFIVDPAMLLIFSAGFVLFLWGLVVFLSNLDETGKRQEGLNHIIWGLVGMLIMVSIWGIIALIENTFGLSPANIDASSINAPNFTPNF